MLNIEDIKERLAMNPEPKEVADIRNKITTTFNMLEFVDPGHKYFLKKPDGSKEELICVSSLVDKFTPEEDWDLITKNYSLNHGIPVERVKRMWKENNIRATNNGTSTHLFAEMYMHFFMGHPEKICDVIKPQYEDGFLIPYSPKQEAVVKFYEDLSRVTDIYPVMPETKVYTDCFSLNYAGTFDALFATYYQGEWCLLVYDWKTNKALENGFKRSKKIMMTGPFNNYVDEALSHYTVQLSAYSIALQNIGYKIIDRELLWLKEDGNYEKRCLPDVTNLLRDAIK